MRAAALSVLLLVAGVGGCTGGSKERATATRAVNDERKVTFTRDVAPILQRNCLICHRSGEGAPFELRTYADARKRARQIAEVTARRYMPPWLPAPQPVEYQDVRHLTDREIETLARWAAAGGPEGDSRDLPPEPTLPSGWRLGQPDLIVELPQPYRLQAEGQDVIRNFVLPLHAAGRFVAAIELHPGASGAVHHATILADASGTARQLDLADPEPGWEGMVGAVAPGGHFLGWTPGHQPRPFGDGLAWEIESGTDLVLQLHLVPTGREESIQPAIGLHWSAEPPRRRPVSIHLGSTAMDIPPGDPAYEVTDSFELPVDVEALSIYPHAHYTGKTMEAWAVAPGGAVLPLLHIDAWDFDWQDEYWFTRSIALPAHTRLHLKYRYDNSAANPRNPFSPPRRARWGPRSTDEMGDYWLQVVTSDPDAVPALRRAVADKDLRIAIDGYRLRLNDDPRDLDALARLGRIHSALGESEPALAYLRRALAIDPRSWLLHSETGLALAAAGRNADAAAEFRAALEANPGSVDLQNNLAAAALALGRVDEARAALEAAHRAQPDSAEIATNLAVVLEREHHFDRALELYGEALRADAGHAAAHGNLGTLLLRLGRPADAEVHLREALRLRPAYPTALKNLANVLAQSGREAEAMDTLRQAIAVDPADADAHFLLALGLAEAGDAAAARDQVNAALALRPTYPEARVLRRQLGD